MAERRRVFGAVLVLLLSLGRPVAAQETSVLLPPSTYLDLFDEADLRGVERPADEVYDLFLAITGDPVLDARIRSAAEARGYVRRPVASAGLVEVDGRRLQGPAAEAWTALVGAAREDGIALVLTSAHRDPAAQQALFRRRLGGATTDSAIEAALRTAAPPGYSKHHTGYAVDIGEAGGADRAFADTRAHAWLAADDFARAKQFGFVPSYPVGGAAMGPNPEAWEFVWVGEGRIACAAAPESEGRFCDTGTSPRADDIAWLTDLGLTVGCAIDRFCPDDTITRGEAASLLWRLHGAPAPRRTAPFVDVGPDDHFGSAVDWLWELGVVSGTGADTFSPDAALLPAEALALLVRLGELDDRPPATGLTAAATAGEPDAAGLGVLGAHISRAEFASILRVVAAG